MRLGVIGLGRMGLPIARRLRAVGNLVSGVDLDPALVAQFARPRPAPLVPHPAKAAPECRFGASGEDGGELDVLVTVLPGPVELRRAMLGPATAALHGRNDEDHVRPDAAGEDDALRRELGDDQPRLRPVAPSPSDERELRAEVGVERELRAAAGVERAARAAAGGAVGAGGALGALGAGALWIDLTSGDPRVARELGREAAARGVDAVGAPMAGGPADAEAGTLGFFVGGAPDAVERALPVLHALGDPRRLERAGDEVGAGHVAKMLANTLWFGQVAAVTEALLIGHTQGLEPEQLAAILRRSAGGSAFIDRHLDHLLEGDYLETFGLDRVVEELDTVTSLAADAGLPVALTGLVAELHREALERFGPVDGELLVAKLLEERAGIRIRRPPAAR
jgi:3-hydroxyisobutyrate dehydrogenase-like beta-hydroxyacid dehydrogenase